VSPEQRVIALSAAVFLASLALGLVTRELWLTCYSLALYVLAVLTTSLLELVRPDRFYRLNFWVFKELLHDLLKFSIALEVALRIFRSFPGARASARWVLLFVFVATYAGVLAFPVTEGYDMLVGKVMPWVLSGTLWVFVAIAALVLWYRLPIHPLHKAILVGFVPYLLMFTLALDIVDRFGWGEAREYSNYLQTVSYLILLLYWNQAVWRLKRP
jgi:hypothetical protein